MTESSSNGEARAWGLQSKLLAGMGAIIIVSLGAIGTMALLGFSNLQTQMQTGDKVIYDKINTDNADVKARLGEICQQNAKTNEILMKHTEEIAVLRTNQQARLDIERRGRK